jgi:hypothetical protein
MYLRLTMPLLVIAFIPCGKFAKIFDSLERIDEEINQSYKHYNDYKNLLRKLGFTGGV